MLIFHDDRCDTEALGADVRQQLFREFVTWADALAKRDCYVGSEALAANAAARTVRRRGETLSVDGPFAESQEAVNGFITVRAPDVDGAAVIAGECPSLRFGWAVEIRELLEIEKPTPSGAGRGGP